MGINTGRVLIGGLAAGAIRTVGDGLASALIFAARYKAEVGKLNPALPAVVDAAPAKIGIAIINALLGIALVFGYAAMRPRFGAGAGTAVRAGLLLWAVGSLVWGTTVMLGLFSWGYVIPRAIASLVTVLIAAYFGAMLYTESGSALDATADVGPLPMGSTRVR